MGDASRSGSSRFAPHHPRAAGIGTISAAVGAAHPGDNLTLSPGTFYDSVFIAIPLHIRGAGWTRTVIRPPLSSHNPCNTTGVDGLCVAGARDANGNPDPGKPVSNVTIDSLRITGFSDSGVFGLNTDRLRVHHVVADHNGSYGIARFVSTHSTFEDDSASYNGEAGLYLGDSPGARSVVRHNTADHNGFGIFLRDSTDITAVDNRVWANCVGIMAINSGRGAPGDLPAGDYHLIDNTALANDMACPAGEHPPLSGVGLGLFGVHGTRVRDNTILDNQPTGPSLASGGIVLASTRATGGADPQHNTVRHNHLRRNQPADLSSDGTGVDNTITGNRCATSIPSDLGGCGSYGNSHN